MKKIFQMGLVALVSVSMSEAVMAQIGAPFIHDPATIAPAVDWVAAMQAQSLPAGVRHLIPSLLTTVSLQLQSVLL